MSFIDNVVNDSIKFISKETGYTAYDVLNIHIEYLDRLDRKFIYKNNRIPSSQEYEHLRMEALRYTGRYFRMRKWYTQSA